MGRWCSEPSLRGLPLRQGKKWREQECWRALLFLFIEDEKEGIFVKVLGYSLYFCRKQMI